LVSIVINEYEYPPLISILAPGANDAIIGVLSYLSIMPVPSLGPNTIRSPTDAFGITPTSASVANLIVLDIAGQFAGAGGVVLVVVVVVVGLDVVLVVVVVVGATVVVVVVVGLAVVVVVVVGDDVVLVVVVVVGGMVVVVVVVVGDAVVLVVVVVIGIQTAQAA
jgi:hypothetical protein